MRSLCLTFKGKCQKKREYIVFSLWTFWSNMFRFTFGAVCAVQFKEHFQKSTCSLYIQSAHQSWTWSWLASLCLNNCWNPSNQASLQSWNWKASPQQVCGSFELQELLLWVSRGPVHALFCMLFLRFNPMKKHFTWTTCFLKAREAY